MQLLKSVGLKTAKIVVKLTMYATFFLSALVIASHYSGGDVVSLMWASFATIIFAILYAYLYGGEK